MTPHLTSYAELGASQYFCTSISSVTPTGDLYKNKPAISLSISPVTPMRDLNKYKIDRSTNTCISTSV